MPHSRPALHVVQITDPHLFADDDGELRGINTARSLQAVLRAVRQQRWPPDLIVLTGDIAQDESRGAYQRLRRMLEPLDVPVLTLPGNHDDPRLMTECLRGERLTYCEPVSLGDWLMLPLATHVPGAVAGEIGAAQLAKLRQTLATCDQRWVVVWLHHHPLPSGSAWLDTIGLRDGHALLAELQASARVRAVLWGHVHQVFEAGRDGVLFASAPSSSRQFRPRSDTFALDHRPPGWRSVQLHVDGTVTTAVHWLDAATGTALAAAEDGNA